MVNVERQRNEIAIWMYSVFTPRVGHARKKGVPKCRFEDCIKVTEVKERSIVSRRANPFIHGRTQYPIAPVVQLYRQV